MSNEARVTASLMVKVGNLSYQNQGTAFNADVDSDKGYGPGAVSVEQTPTVTQVPLDNLDSLGGLCMIQNLSDEYAVEYGVYVGGSFYPLHKLLPGEKYPCRLSDNLWFGAHGSGSGTSHDHSLAFRAFGGVATVQIDAFNP